jgi:phage tail-like protein
MTAAPPLAALAQLVRVPDVMGRSLAQARAILADRGIGGITVLYRDSYAERDTVVDQHPPRDHVADATGTVTLWVARRGFVAQLPAIYRRGASDTGHITRALCWIFEHLLDSAAAPVAEPWRLFDPRTAPADMLDWLARWTAFALDAGWSDVQRRTLLGRAVELYRLRGTRRGLVRYLELFTGVTPDITEGVWPFRALRAPGDGAETGARIGVDAVVDAHVDRTACFVVTLPIDAAELAPDLVDRIHRIIAAEKPAHTHYCLRAAPSRANPTAAFAIGVTVVAAPQDHAT